MKSKATYLFGICIILFVAGISTKSFAQPSLGIVWSPPDDTATANHQLGTFSALGITHLEISHPIEPSLRSIVSQSDFTILVRSDNYFLTISEIQKNKAILRDNFLDLAQEYRAALNVAGLGLLSHSHTDHVEFHEVFSPIIDSLSSISNKSFYYFHQDEWFNFVNPEQSFAALFNNKSYEPKDLKELDNILNYLVTEQSQKLLFFRSAWFLEAVEQYPEFTHSLIKYRDTNEWELPLPNTSETTPDSNWIVLILLTLWVALAVQVKYLPYVRPMMLRYFLAHRFFVDDILHYRERYATAGIFMMINHAFFGGLVFYITAQVLLSEIGVEAFFNHLPWLAITGVNYFSFFFTGFILVLLTQFIALLWIHLPAKTLGHFSQTINLYAGVFYIDYLILTLMVTLFAAGIGSSLNIILSILYILIWFGAFNIAAFDASRNMESGRPLYLLLTFGLHTIATFFLIISILLYTNFIEILDLSFSL